MIIICMCDMITDAFRPEEYVLFRKSRGQTVHHEKFGQRRNS